MHQELVDRLPESRSVQKLEEAVQEILSSAVYQELVPQGQPTEAWTQSYPERHQS